MANSYLNALNKENNYTLTENGGLAHKTTGEALYDLFAQGGAYRKRSDADCIFLFKKAYEDNSIYARKCLFYLRDAMGQGQGERRFFRVCMRWMANEYPDATRRNLELIPEYGRWDDLYIFVGTAVEHDMWQFMRKQLMLDMESKTPSLLAKWLKSENTSSAESCALGNKTRLAFGMSHKQYRKTLSVLRKRINVLERLMSERRWDEIEFDKIPSKAGLIYKNAFARHDVERMKAAVEVQSYADFAKDKNAKVNTKALFPYEIVAKSIALTGGNHWYWYNDAYERIPLDSTDRLMINKYWENYGEELAKLDLNALCVIDTSGSMMGNSASAPMNIAIALGMMAADKAKGPFHGHYVSFSSRPQLIKVDGVDFVDKVFRIYRTNLCENTNLEATFDMLLNTAIRNKVKQEDLPKSIIVISDMQIDAAYGYYWGNSDAKSQNRTMMEKMRTKWAQYGYTLPKMVYWQVDARQDTFLDDGPDITYCSGASATLFRQISEGKTGMQLMYDKLNSERYAPIQ